MSGEEPWQQPGVGDVVHWYPIPYLIGAPLPEPTAAIITRVHEDPHFVAIECFGVGDKPARHRGVPFSPTPRAGHWTWRPR